MEECVFFVSPLDQQGRWQALLVGLSAQHRDDEYLMIDSTSVRVHQHAAGPGGGQLAHAMGRSRASLSTKIHLACDALGYPLGFILTGANVSDFDQCKPLLKAHLKSASSSGGDESVRLDFEVDTNAMTDRFGELLQAAFDAHRLSLVDSKTVAALCYHEILGIPLLEAKSLAEESITE